MPRDELDQLAMRFMSILQRSQVAAQEVVGLPKTCTLSQMHHVLTMLAELIDGIYFRYID